MNLGMMFFLKIQWLVPTRSDKEYAMSVARVTEIKSSSTFSFDDAIRAGVERAHKTLKNVKSAWIENQEVLVDDEGVVCEYRVQMKVTFILED
jgi:dodecin